MENTPSEDVAAARGEEVAAARGSDKKTKNRQVQSATEPYDVTTSKPKRCYQTLLTLIYNFKLRTTGTNVLASKMSRRNVQSQIESACFFY
jgi:hypothetical protein